MLTMTSRNPVARGRVPLRMQWRWMLALALLGAGSAAAETTRQYQIVPEGGTGRLELKEVEVPQPGTGEVVVRVRAVSLNRRDIYILQGSYPAGDTSGRVPLSDGAGEVIAAGPGVTRFKVGDRVAATFFEGWLDGKFSPAVAARARGGQIDGMLSEVVVKHEDSFVRIPDHLSYEQAATLPCAGVTAWNGLFKYGKLAPGDYVLLEGTGGVSIIGLQLAAAAGAKPIITSSSDDKLAIAKRLGAFATVNYRKNPDWEQQVRAATGGTGVDQVLEVGGQDTLTKALDSLAFGGHVALIGGLSGFGGNLPVGSLMGRGASATGVYVGSRADFEAMNEFIAKHHVEPYVDKVFDFTDAPAAFMYMKESEFVGKIVITLN